MKKHVVIDNPVVSNIVFYPQKSPIPLNLDSNTEILEFQVEKNVTIGGFFFLNDMSLPTILLFHGNGEIAIDYRSLAPLFFECGVNLAVVDYRGYGFSSGKPYYTSLINDAPVIYENFIDWINKRGLNNSIFIQGRSLGSVCAAEIGSNNPKNLKGIIFESGFASLYNIMTYLFRVSSSQVTPTSLIKYSNDTRIKQFKKPVLIIHGTSDFIIPSSEGELIYESLPIDIDKSLVLIEGAGHNDILLYHDKYFDPLSEFIEKFK
ncbi:MAG: alpha/beta hydrolase [Candidatus Heimdallarchaeota archaeon]